MCWLVWFGAYLLLGFIGGRGKGCVCIERLGGGGELMKPVLLRPVSVERGVFNIAEEREAISFYYVNVKFRVGWVRG